MDWFLYDIGLRHEKVNPFSTVKLKKKSIFEVPMIRKL